MDVDRGSKEPAVWMFKILGCGTVYGASNL